MPDSCRICGVPTAPAASTTSRAAHTGCGATPARTTSTPWARKPLLPCSSNTRLTLTPVHTRRLRRERTGCKKALLAFQRTPARWLTSK
jgi:hypothetical protein